MVEPTLTTEPPRAPEEQLKLMALHLRSDRERLLIATTPDSEAEYHLAEEIRLRLENEVAVEDVTLSSASLAQLSLSQQLSALPPPSGKAVVFVFGLDDLLPGDRDTAINALNWGRERLRWTGYSVVLWVRPETAGELGNRAPDFFSWRSDVLAFDVPTHPAERQQALARLRLFAPALLDDLRQRYLDYVIRTYQWLDFRGLLQLRNVVWLPLDHVFVPLHATTATASATPFDRLLTSESTHDVEWPRYESRFVERRVALADAVHRHRYLLLLGDPGSGKSTILRFLALTFAQGQDHVREKLGHREDRLPILVPLSAFSDALKGQPDLSLAAFLPSYFTGQGLPDFSPLFDDALRSGRAMLLLDGLDEMLTYDDRATVSLAVAEFADLYPTTRIVVTSRIAGYAPGMLPTSFATLTVAPFDDAAIRQFARQWSHAFEAMRLPSSSALPPDAHHRATRRAENLTHAAISHPGVRRLATNPLLLTLLALIHYQGTRLPNRRADLYRLCVEALAETWNLARSLSGRPIDLRLGERRLDEAFVVGILAPIAHWLHETQPTGAVGRGELESQVAKRFVENEGATSDEATVLARDFVDLAREQLGLLVERAPNVFSFLHLSVQEYLVARFLSERLDGFEHLRPRLHHPRWREVVLLTAGCLQGDYAVAFVEKLLDAHSPFADLLPRALALGHPPPSSFVRRIMRQDRQTGAEIQTVLLSIMDVLLAANCVGDSVPVPPQLSQPICTALFKLWLHPPFSELYDNLASAFAQLSSSNVGKDVRDFLVDLLQDSNADEIVRRKTVAALRQGWAGDPEIKTYMLHLVQNVDENPQVRRVTVGALSQGWAGDSKVKADLLHLLQSQKNPSFAPEIPLALVAGWPGDLEIRAIMLDLLEDASEDGRVRYGVAAALGIGWPGDLQIKTYILCCLHNSAENEWARAGAVLSLSLSWLIDPEVRATLLHILRDSSEGVEVRIHIAQVLSQTWINDSEVRTTLLHIVNNSDENIEVRSETIKFLINFTSTDSEINMNLIQILQTLPTSYKLLAGYIQVLHQISNRIRDDQDKREYLNTLLRILSDNKQPIYLRQSAIRGLGQEKVGTELIKTLVNELIQVFNEPELRDTILSSVWTLLYQDDLEL